MSSLDSEINDMRKSEEFKGISFSGFKKGDVKKELLNSFINGKIEPACYWSAELVCSGHFSDVWEVILYFYSKYIHIGNPKLAVLLDMRLQTFKEIMNNGYLGMELKMRNNNRMRRLFAEIVCILCEMERKHSYDEIKVGREDFLPENLSERLKAPSRNYATLVAMSEDPKELFVATNELAFHLSKDGQNAIQSCYWIEWIMEYESIKKNKKEKCFCERRAIIPVDTKFQKDLIWIVWDALLKEANARSALVVKIVNSLLGLFCLRYTTTNYRKRKFIMYLTISLLTENIVLTDDMLKEKTKEAISNVTSKIDFIYKQIKQNEKSPNTDYLFKNIKITNLEKTIEKLEKMNEFGETFIPKL